MTVEPSTGGQYWPDGDEFGGGALEQVKAAWPFLPRDLRLALVAIATLVEQPTMDHDGPDVFEPDDIPF